MIECPYQGAVDPQIVADVSRELLDMGCYEVSLGDTIGAGTPGSFETMLHKVLEQVDRFNPAHWKHAHSDVHWIRRL